MTRSCYSHPLFVAGVSIPRTELCRKATHLVGRITPPWLMNHLFRSYVFGELLGRKRGQLLDPELLYVATMMHTVGLTAGIQAAQRFELQSADATRRLLEKHGVAEARVKRACRAVLLHTASGIESCLDNGVGLVRVGVLADVEGRRLREISLANVREIFATWPVLNFRDEFPKLLQQVELRTIDASARRSVSSTPRTRATLLPTWTDALVQA
jgi:hypothetical protein